MGSPSASVKPCAPATEALPVAIAFAPASATALALPASQALNRSKGSPATCSAAKAWNLLGMIPPRFSDSAASMDEARDHVAIGSADLHLLAAAEHQEAFSVGVRLDLLDLVEVDDGRAVDALEAARIEALLEILHRLAQDQGVVAGIDAHIVAGGVDLLDRIDVDAEDLAAVLDVDHLLVAVGGVRVLDPFHILHRFGGDVGEHFLQCRHLLDAALLGEPDPHPLERVGEPRLVDRLHEIVDRVGLERAQRVVRISGDEDEKWRLDLH